jgi:lysophospholipase L1-like esterase
MKAHRLTKIGVSICAALVAIAGVELALRAIWNLPDSFFEFVVLSRTPYAPHAQIAMDWGPIRYVVRANNLGFRGDDEIAHGPPAGVTRIVAIGDSITNGFFVDNPDTYPAQLQQFLRSRGRRVEVVNGARSGATITGEFDALQNGAMQLRPAIVLLTFVTNDIAELMEGPFQHPPPSRWRAAAGLLLARTAIGEVAGRGALAARYWWRGRRPPPKPAGHERYAIPGGDRIAENLARFAATEADGADALILGERFTPDVDRAMQAYLDELRRVRTYCVQHGAQLVFVYLPAYSQVYGNAPMTARDRLKTACDADRIAFIDLTPAMRARGRSQVLHLAPTDFHLNPNGYAVMAETIGAWLLENRQPL